MRAPVRTEQEGASLSIVGLNARLGGLADGVTGVVMFQMDDGRRHNSAVEAQLRQAFARFRGEAQREFGQEFYRSYIERLRLVAFADGVVTLAAETTTARDRVMERASHRLESVFRAECASVQAVEVLLLRDVPEEERESFAPAPLAPALAAEHPLGYTFDAFCVDESNFRAYTVATVIASGAGVAFPLTIIWGPTGSGKTHLLNALKHALEQQGAGRSAKVVWAQEFLEDFVQVMNKQRDSAAFREAVRGPNVLMIDEIHRIFGKRATEQELLATIALRAERGGQVIVTADRDAPDFECADPRLREILLGAASCEIKAPSPDLRRRILEMRVKHFARHTPGFSVEPAVLDMIAQRLPVSGRELDGIVGLLLLEAKVRGELNVTMEAAETALQGKLNGAVAKRITMQQVVKTVCTAYGLTHEELLAKTRRQNIARPRQIVMYLSVTMAGRTLPYVAEKLGNLDHTTVMWGRNKFAKLYEADPQVRAEIDDLKRRIHADAR